jgi:hypothetical protein
MSLFREPGDPDPYDSNAAFLAAVDCLEAIDQAAVIAEHARGGAKFTEKAALRCIFDLDLAYNLAGKFHANHPPPHLPGDESTNSASAETLLLAKRLRVAVRRAVQTFKASSNAPTNGWTVLWDAYSHFLGRSVGPTYGDSTHRTEGVDADEEGIIYETIIFIPEELKFPPWHFDAWPSVVDAILALNPTELRKQVFKLLSGVKATPLPARAAPAGSAGKRKCFDRDHTMLGWYEKITSETYHSNAKIRDRWNSDNGDCVSINTVITAIKTAKKEREAERK